MTFSGCQGKVLANDGKSFHSFAINMREELAIDEEIVLRLKSKYIYFNMLTNARHCGLLFHKVPYLAGRLRKTTALALWR